jgi:D-arabinose 1-dehydrogenase-like Zn-dependent alcohol dehydrogenase
MPFQAFVFKDIILIGSLIADPAEGEGFIRFFHENKLHVAVKEWKMEQAEEMRQEYLTGKSIGKNVVVID